MSFYGSRVPTYVKGDNEGDLQKKLIEIGIATDSKLEIINIYPKGSFIYAWYFIDASRHGIPNKEEMARATKANEKKTKEKNKEANIKP